MKIILNNTTSRLIGNAAVIKACVNRTKIKSNGYFFSPAYRERKWDGFIRYVSEATGTFPTGMIHQILEILKDEGESVKIQDVRKGLKKINAITELGGKTFRENQLASSNAVLTNKILGFQFRRGILHEATNFGKSLVAGGIFASYESVGVLLINNTEIFVQLVEDLKKLLGNDLVGEVSAKKTDWKRYNVCMVQTLANRIKSNRKIKEDMARVQVVIVDEADEVANRKDTKYILAMCFDAPCRVAMTGTIPDVEKKKFKEKYQLLINFFGPVIHRTSNAELIAEGTSTPPKITFSLGNTSIKGGTYQDELDRAIIRNKRRNKKIWKKVRRKIKNNKGPIFILIRYSEHINQLLKTCPDDLKENLRIESAYGKTKNRASIIKRFNKGRVDVFICSMILRRGKNVPLIRTLINAAGGDSEAGILQMLGRALRKDASKDEVDIEEFYDLGKYLMRHSKHRLAYYKKDGHEVNERYKKKLPEAQRKLREKYS